MLVLERKNIVVVGAGRTGLAVSRFCARRGARVIVSDRDNAINSKDQFEQLRSLGVRLELGGHRAETFRDAELIVMSPGVSENIPPVRKAAAGGIPVTGEIELAAGFIKTPMVAVTGTNGKTTSCELLADMLERSGRKVFLGGNIGNPLINYPDQSAAVDVIVVEVSSFQLDTIRTFRPKVGVLLNISADHLDRYHDFEAYAASKMRLFENQTAEDVAVINAGDRVISRLTENLVNHKLVYPDLATGQSGAALENNRIRLAGVSAATGISQPLEGTIDLNDLSLMGRHNRENVCAAALGALAAGGNLDGVQSAVNQFNGLPHRLEKIACINGVDYVNDSKATNVDAVARALACFSGSTILIMGGLDKGSDFESLAQPVAAHSRLLIVIGAARRAIRTALEKVIVVEEADDLAAAVQLAQREAEPGDTVLLSPGCASFDQYENYRARGRDFRSAVAALNQ